MTDPDLSAIIKHTQLDLRVIKEMKKKDTLRAPRVFHCEAAGKEYLLILPTTAHEYFYLQRAICQQEEFLQINDHFDLNLPLSSNLTKHIQSSYALYEYYSPALYCDTNDPVPFLQEIYERHAYETDVTDEFIKRIKKEFLGAWPQTCHHTIITLREFDEYFKELRSLKTVKLAFEHGDFTTNNILLMNDGMYLTDFEFARNDQPIGYDIYDYWSSLNQAAQYQNDIPNYHLHELKYRLINRINALVDGGDFSLLIFDYVTVEVEKQWAELYQRGGQYNLSPDWCKEWMIHFGTDTELHLVTYWQNAKIVLLAPFYIRKGEQTLRLIGTAPDLLDQFSFLCGDPKYHPFLIRFLSASELKVDLRFIDASSLFAKALHKHLLNDNISYVSTVIDTKPSAKQLKIKAKERSDVKRLQNRAKQREGEDIAFVYNVPRDPRYIKEFVLFHTRRWQGGPFQNLPGFLEFVENLYYNSDIVCLSRLYFPTSDVSLAYHFGYADSNDVFWSSIPSYNVKYSELSPGKVLLYFLAREVFNRGLERLDFGRGAESYKYWFSNEDSLLLNISFPQKTGVPFIFKRVVSKFARKIASLRG